MEDLVAHHHLVILVVAGHDDLGSVPVPLPHSDPWRPIGLELVDARNYIPINSFEGRGKAAARLGLLKPGAKLGGCLDPDRQRREVGVGGLNRRAAAQERATKEDRGESWCTEY